MNRLPGLTCRFIFMDSVTNRKVLPSSFDHRKPGFGATSNVIKMSKFKQTATSVLKIYLARIWQKY